jgi:hypothetical protein
MKLEQAQNTPPQSGKIFAEDAEVEELEDQDGFCIRSTLNGWELREGQSPLPAIKVFELRVTADEVCINLPEFSDRIMVNAGGTFSHSHDNECGKVNVNGRLRGQIVIVNAEKQDCDRTISLRLSGVLPFEIEDRLPTKEPNKEVLRAIF